MGYQRKDLDSRRFKRWQYGKTVAEHLFDAVEYVKRIDR